MEIALKKPAAWAVGILTALVTLAFAMSGVMKVMHAPEVVQGFTRAGIPEGAILPLGIIELACLALYLIPGTVVLGTLLLTGYLGGAVLANIIGRTDYIHALVVGLFVWAGAWFRVVELRALIPIRDESGKELI
jgi:DoxX-like family